MPFSSLTEGRCPCCLLYLLHRKIDKLVLKRQYKPGWIFQDTCKLWSRFEARFVSSDETPSFRESGYHGDSMSEGTSMVAHS